MAKTRMISILKDAQGNIIRDAAGYAKFDEVAINHDAPLSLQEAEYEPFEALRTVKVNGRSVQLPLKEAFVLQPDAANMLRQDIRYLAFSMFKELPRSFTSFTRFEQSNNQEESWLRDAAMGVLPLAPSGTELPDLRSSSR